MILSGSVTIYTSEKGIKRTERYWLASALAEGVTISTAGWTTEVQTATAEKPYLWTYEKVVYTDDSYEVFGPVVNSVRGAQGWKGALPRIGKWESGGTYYSGGEGEEFYDIKLYGGKYYLCKANHSGRTTTPDQDTGYWIEATNEWKFIATDLIKADKGVVENLNANYITMTDENDQIIFCAKDGEVTCNTGTFQNIEVSGNSKLTDVTVTGTISHSSATEGDYTGADLYYLPSIGYNVTIKLGEDQWSGETETKPFRGDIGKRILMMNSSPVTATAVYRVRPCSFGWTSSGTAVIDNTVDSSYLIAPQETIELTCFALPSGTKVGGYAVTEGGIWKITNRFSGYSLQPIVAMGIVTNSTTSATATISAQSVFGTSGFSVTRSSTGSGDGLYTITFPASFASLKTPLVQITGIGYRQGETSTGPVKGTFISWTPSTRKMVVAVSDDDTANGGSFSFVVYSFNGWSL